MINNRSLRRRFRFLEIVILDFLRCIDFSLRFILLSLFMYKDIEYKFFLFFENVLGFFDF